MGIFPLMLVVSSLGKVTWASSIRIQLGSDDVDDAPIVLTVLCVDRKQRQKVKTLKVLNCEY